MTDIWFEEDLLPEPNALAQITEGVKSTDEQEQLTRIRGSIRVHKPREKFLDDKTTRTLMVGDSNYHYLLVRLGCEFDPGPDARAAKTGFVSAVMSVYLWGKSITHPRVYSLAPTEVNSGKPTTVRLKLAPSITLVSGAGGSLGEIETDLTVGQIAPVVRGFAGEDERQPYWNLEHHREAPLYGMRHFWLLLEVPSSLDRCFLSCRVEGYLQTLLGRLLMVPEMRDFAYRPRHTIHLAPQYTEEIAFDHS